MILRLTDGAQRMTRHGHFDRPPEGWDAEGPVPRGQAEAIARHWSSRQPHVQSYRARISAIRAWIPDHWRKFCPRIDYAAAVQEVLVRLIAAYGRRPWYEVEWIERAVEEVRQELEGEGSGGAAG